ncbi:helix-turn-helix domain-containing protein [Afipia massiliensis]|uniref:Helix-turn-helix domain-containing protein n=1 Tax=Afipia massiliensis TaxID=211460 RepID=A0A4U6BJV5_9BRAD|nr:helix-turn-helix domain-containing protein [Afipia massiliensis]TKT70500.1 helix-turn-helix domain-containing protein [Afipia massiliensis]
MSDGFSVTTSRVHDFEGFREAVHGSHVDVMQLERGRLHGSLTHVGIGNFSLSVGSFSTGIRTQRTSKEQKLIVGMLLESKNRVTHWSYDMRPGDVLVIPPSIDHDGRFFGASSYAAIRLDLADVSSIFGGETDLADPATWSVKSHYKADPRLGVVAIQRLRKIMSRLADPNIKLPEQSADFWRRSITDAMMATVMHSLPSDNAGPPLSATRLIRNVEHYIEAVGIRPVHIAELCAEFGVSRRSLHRAFDEVLGIGPVTFLRYKRLCGVHSILRESDPARTTVAEVAIQHGFIELGRFAQYYHTLFGEHPSETLRAPAGSLATSQAMFRPRFA